MSCKLFYNVDYVAYWYDKELSLLLENKKMKIFEFPLSGDFVSEESIHLSIHKISKNDDRFILEICGDMSVRLFIDKSESQENEIYILESNSFFGKNLIIKIIGPDSFIIEQRPFTSSNKRPRIWEFQRKKV